MTLYDMQITRVIVCAILFLPVIIIIIMYNCVKIRHSSRVVQDIIEVCTILGTRVHTWYNQECILDVI